MGGQGGEFRPVIEPPLRLRVALPGLGLQVDPERGFQLPLPDRLLQREIRLGVGDQAFGEALIKLAVLFDWAVT
jgi:hypothetical protein